MLTDEQLNQFARQGFVVVRSAIAERLCKQIDNEIAQTLANDPPDAGTLGKHFYYLDPTELPVADRALRESNALALAEQICAPHHLVHSFGHIQIALNFPTWDHTPGGPHLDGYHDTERPHPFTMLAGIFLGDESRPSSGNLWVWPGSHIVHSELFRTQGAHALMATGGHYPDAVHNLEPPVPILASRGDLLLAHYLLGHNSGGNTTNQTRRAVYYRLGTPSTDDNDSWATALVDPFHEYPTIGPN